jgi:hypothetical protein
MTTGELIKQSISVPVKELAGDLNLSVEQVYKWTQEAQRNPLDRTKAIMDACDNDDIIRHLCDHSGGYYITAPKSNEGDAQICSKACKEFSEMLNVMSVALQDGKVDKAEYINIKKEWSDLVSVMEGFLDSRLKGI